MWEKYHVCWGSRGPSKSFHRPQEKHQVPYVLYCINIIYWVYNTWCDVYILWGFSHEHQELRKGLYTTIKITQAGFFKPDVGELSMLRSVLASKYYFYLCQWLILLDSYSTVLWFLRFDLFSHKVNYVLLLLSSGMQYLIPSSSWMYSTWCPSAPLHHMDCIDHVGDEFVYCLSAAVCSTFCTNGPLHCLESRVFIDHVWLQLATVASLHCLSRSCIILSLYCHVLCSTFWTCALLHCLVSYFDYVLYCYALLDCSTVQHFCSRWISLGALKFIYSYFISPTAASGSAPWTAVMIVCKLKARSQHKGCVKMFNTRVHFSVSLLHCQTEKVQKIKN